MLRKVSLLLLVLNFSSNAFAGPKMAIVFFMGGAVNVLSEIGPDIEAHVRRHYPSVEIVGGNQDWSEYRNICRQIAQDRSIEKVILIGHSHGAHAAVAASACLEQAGRRVDLLVTLDTISWLQIPGNPSIIPDNVTYNYNLFQSSVFFNGRSDNRRPDGSVRGIHGRLLNVPTFPLPHADLDNYALLLTNWLVSYAIVGRMECVAIPGNDQNPMRVRSLRDGEYNNLDYINQNFLRPECR